MSNSAERHLPIGENTIPVAVIVVIIVQLLGFGYLGGQMRQLISQNSASILRLENDFRAIQPIIQGNNRESAVINQRLSTITLQLDRIEKEQKK